MYHVLTGYGRDALGEDALGYTHSRHGELGRFIAFMGNRQIAKGSKRSRVRDSRGGRRNGKRAANS